VTYKNRFYSVTYEKAIWPELLQDCLLSSCNQRVYDVVSLCFFAFCCLISIAQLKIENLLNSLQETEQESMLRL